MIEIIKNIKHNGIINTKSPATGNSFVSLGGVDYLIGSLFILLGILVFVMFQNKAKIKSKKYKEEQLKIYNKNRKTKISDYKKTSLYLPF